MDLCCEAAVTLSVLKLHDRNTVDLAVSVLQRFPVDCDRVKEESRKKKTSLTSTNLSRTQEFARHLIAYLGNAEVNKQQIVKILRGVIKDKRLASTETKVALTTDSETQKTAIIALGSLRVHSLEIEELLVEVAEFGPREELRKAADEALDQLTVDNDD